jgi:ABC-type multidrug transport system fused ATPase/permease subunit
VSLPTGRANAKHDLAMDTQPGQNGAGAADREGVQETAARHGADASASRSAQPEWPYSGQPAESVHEAQPSVPDDEFAEQLDIAVAETAEQNDLTLGRERMSLVRHEVLSTPLAAEEDPNVDGVPRTAVQEAAQADGIGIDPASQGKHPKHAAGALESQSTSAIATAGSAYFQYQGRQAGVTDYHRYAQDQMRRIAEAAALTATGDSASRKPLPELEASWLSRWTFWWFGSLIWRGWRRTLDDSDLYELAPDDRAQPLSERFAVAWVDFLERQEERITRELERERQARTAKTGALDGVAPRKDDSLDHVDEEQLRIQRRSRWPMFWVILRVHTRIIIVSGILKFFDVGLGQVSPVFLNKLLIWLETPGAPTYQGYLWVLAIFLAPFLKAFVENQYFYLTFRLAVRIRGEVQSAVYDKSLRLSASARAQTTTGEVVNHMQLDAQRLSDFMQYAHVLWAALLQIGGALALLIVYLGYSGLIGFLAAVLTVPLQGYLVKRLSGFRRLTFGITDRRVKLLNEMFQGIKTLKFYAWEEPFAVKVTEIREQELAAYRRTVFVRTLFYVVLFVTPVLVSAVTFGFYGGVFHNQLNPAFIFAGLSVLNNLRFPLIQYPFVFTALVDARIGVQRLQRFFALEEIEPSPATERLSTDAKSSSSSSDLMGDPAQKLTDKQKRTPSAEDAQVPPAPHQPEATRSRWRFFWRKPVERAAKHSAPSSEHPTDAIDGADASGSVMTRAREPSGAIPAEEASSLPGALHWGPSIELPGESAAFHEQAETSTILMDSTDTAENGQGTGMLLDKPSKDLSSGLGRASSSLRKEPMYVIEIEHGCFDWTLSKEQPAPASASASATEGQQLPKRRLALFQRLWHRRELRRQPPQPEVRLKPVEFVPALEDVNLRIPPRALVAVVGRVGSGKSSLVSAILGELQRRSGTVRVHGSVAYSAQAAWIYNGTVRDNILFGLPYEPKRYRRAIYVSALNADLEILPAGDLTEIGEKGINLSGGQKQRVSLARLVYANADVNILDDPLSALDAHVGDHVFQKILSNEHGVLRRKTRVLVTNHLQYASRCDWIVLMENGRIAGQGTLQHLTTSSPRFVEMLAAMTATRSTQSKTQVGDPNTEPAEDDLHRLDADDADGHRERSESTKERTSFFSSSGVGSGDPSVTGRETQKSTDRGQLVVTEEINKGHVALSVYWGYAKRCGNPYLFIAILSLFFVSAGEAVVNNWWLSFWSEHEQQYTLGFFLGIYFALAAGHAIISFFRTYWFLLLTLVAARYLHAELLDSVLRAPMAFYDVTPVGRILVRFSRDIMQIDFQLPQQYISFLQQIASIIAAYVFIAVIFPIFVAAMVPITVLYFVLQQIYNPANIQFRRLDSISKGPIYSHFSETLNGLTTIRAYRRQAYMQAVNRFRIDINQRAYYHQVTGNRWLALRLEVLGALLVFITGIFGVTSKNTTYVGLTGLALTYALQVTSALSLAVRSITEVEQLMNSVERNFYYTDSIPHENLDGEEPPPSWPQVGEIVFEDVSLRYRPQLPLVLQDVTFRVAGGERVGILGRTGSGKSSIIVALFRLVEIPVNETTGKPMGRILIDGLDISKLRVRSLRSRLTIIPQDPVLFSGSIRLNLDPFGLYTDAELWSALRYAHLDDAVHAMPGGLEAQVAEYGENLSAGQRQLICLARALLRHPRILISDEATSSVDFQTDKVIQDVIRQQFEDATLLAIAHRLFTLAAFDTCLVMHHGRVAEYGDPEELLSTRPDGQFSRLVYSLGPRASARFRALLREHAPQRRHRQSSRKGRALSMTATSGTALEAEPDSVHPEIDP